MINQVINPVITDVNFLSIKFTDFFDDIHNQLLSGMCYKMIYSKNKSIKKQGMVFNVIGYSQIEHEIVEGLFLYTVMETNWKTETDSHY